MDETKMTKGSNGWRAETKIALGMTRPDDFKRGDLAMLLVISTSKAMNGGLYSSANVQAEGFGVVTFEIGGDFSKTIERDRAARCAEKTVAAMQERALGRKEALLAEAKAFYAAKGAA